MVLLIPVRFGLMSTAQSVSAALQREDQICPHTRHTRPKFFDFADLPPHLKGVRRFVEDGLPFRCRDRLELTLVFEARDLNLVIEKMVRSGI